MRSLTNTLLIMVSFFLLGSQFGWKGYVLAAVLMLAGYALGGVLYAIHSVHAYGFSYREIAAVLIFGGSHDRRRRMVRLLRVRRSHRPR